MTSVRKPATFVHSIPGIVALMLAAAVIGGGFMAGVPFMPFGGVGVAACVYAVWEMLRTKKGAPGYAAFVVAVCEVGTAFAILAFNP